MEKLTKQACEQALKELPLWALAKDGNAYEKTYHFKDFKAAFAWMTTIAAEAEKMDHHPNWCQSWNRVEVVLTTHDVGGISQRDIALAQIMEQSV